MLQLSSRFLYGISCFIVCLFIACSGDNNKEKIAIPQALIDKEIAQDVKILYSDSSMIRIKIISPLMYRYKDKQKVIEEFPNGLQVEFFDNNQRITSWLEADYALRKESEELILLKKNVVLNNKRQEKLETEELIYDAKNGEIYTDKFVRITQPTKGDTSFGYGFITDMEFNRFQIKTYSAIKKFDELEKLLEGN